MTLMTPFGLHTDTKKSRIKPAKKMFNFNTRRYSIYGKRRKSLKEIIFPKHRGFWWKGSHNGVFGPGGHTSYEFKSGNLALVVSLIFMVLLLGYIVLDIFVLK
jgi:hypothetical protein